MPRPSAADWSLRRITAADEAFLRALYASTREDEEPIKHWPNPHRDHFLAQQYAAQTTHYAQAYAGAERSIVMLGKRPIGRLIVHLNGNDRRIVDISILSEFRGRGLGESILRQTLATAEAAGQSVSLHVIEGNPAFRLYTRLGFTILRKVPPDRLLLEWRAAS